MPEESPSFSKCGSCSKKEGDPDNAGRPTDLVSTHALPQRTQPVLGSQAPLERDRKVQGRSVLKKKKVHGKPPPQRKSGRNPTGSRLPRHQHQERTAGGTGAGSQENQPELQLQELEPSNVHEMWKDAWPLWRTGQGQERLGNCLDDPAKMQVFQFHTISR